jgi:hypothetical protein
VATTVRILLLHIRLAGRGDNSRIVASEHKIKKWARLRLPRCDAMAACWSIQPDRAFGRSVDFHSLAAV